MKEFKPSKQCASAVLGVQCLGVDGHEGDHGNGSGISWHADIGKETKIQGVWIDVFGRVKAVK